MCIWVSVEVKAQKSRFMFQPRKGERGEGSFLKKELYLSSPKCIWHVLKTKQRVTQDAVVNCLRSLSCPSKGLFLAIDIQKYKYYVIQI